MSRAVTHRLAVFGNPVAHSRSPEIHQLFAAQAGIAIEYEKILVPVDEFRAHAHEFFASGALGANVTVPFKQDAFECVDSLSASAEIAQAVNTILRMPNGTLRGDNTDGSGLVNDMKTNLGWTLKNKSILILGAGGAVAGVLPAVFDEAPQSVTVTNRTMDKARKLGERFTNHNFMAQELADLHGPYDVIISGSSAGLAGDSEPFSLPAHCVHNKSCYYDMIYGRRTPFLNWCRNRGQGEVADGLGMLVEQAACSFRLWFDVTVDTRSVLDRLRNEA